MAWYRPFRRETPVTEVAQQTAPPPAGFAHGIPVGGTTEYNQGITTSADNDRRSMLEQLYQAYLTCPWASASVDTIARTITAGGLDVVWDGDAENVPDAPPQVVALQALFGFVNPNEDIRQLMRGVITDLLVFGDAYIECVWVGNTIAALYSLDAPSMNILADEHGVISSYVQITDNGQRASFEPREVIHISLDTPRSGINGVSPTQKNLLPITVWLFTAATLKEVMRKGDPANLHVDMPAEQSEDEIKRWRAQYMVRNLGSRNIGTPVTTRGGATVKELKAYAVEHYITVLDQKRDEILSGYGVPPAKVGVIESGNLGGGTGTSQDRTFKVNTCGPTGELVTEKFDFHLGGAFAIPEGWKIKFGEVDWRDDETVDKISSQRVRDGRWSLNRARAEIGEPPVDGGDDPVLVLSREVVIWDDIASMSHNVANAPTGGGLGATPPAPAAPVPAGAQPEEPALMPDDGGTTDGRAKESNQADARRAWQAAYVAELVKVRNQLREKVGSER